MKNQFCLRGNHKLQNPQKHVVFLLLFVLLAVFVAGCDKEIPLNAPINDAQENIAAVSKLNAPELASAPVVSSITDLGAIGQPASVLTRDGGSSTVVGGKMLWLFGDSFFKNGVKSVDGDSFRSNSAAIADLTMPLDVTERLDINDTPYKAIPFTAAEKAYNASTGRLDDRIALWPGGMMTEKSGKGLVFYLKIHVLPNPNDPGKVIYQPLGVGTARFASGKTTASRDTGLLFNANEPQFNRPLVYNGMVYLYGSLPTVPGSFPSYGVARAPFKNATKRSAYTFWNGSAWVSDVNQATAIMYFIPGAVTVSYNAYLQTFIAIHSQFDSDKIVFKTASSPEGPWSLAAELFTGMPAAGTDSNNRAGQEHPELAKDNGQTIYVSYYNPQSLLQGDLRLVEVTFN